jgi:apolipoprotein N-acyltransferase
MACLCVHFQDAFGRSHYWEPFGRVAFVQPYIPQAVKWDESKAPEIVSILKENTLTAAASRPDLILWPEASTPWAVHGDASVQRFVESLAQEAKAPLLLGSIAIENPHTPQAKWYNGAMVVSPQFGLQHDFYAKRHLVPFGEYVPLRPVLGWLSKFVPIGDDFNPGPDSSPLIVRLHNEPIVFGPLVCYEDIFPDLARYSVRAGSNALVVVTNNAWYGEGAAAYQHAAHAVLRAVELRRPVLRCGNGGWSGWIDEFGTIRAVLTRDAQGNIHTDLKSAADGTIYFRGTATVNVTRDSRWTTALTYYAAHGDWFVVASAVMAAIALAMLMTIARTRPKPEPVETAA